jgi:prolyl-tRNA synthetase
VKFTDAEVMGMPTSVVVGRGLVDGLVEVRDRVSGERVEIPLTDAVAHLLAVVHDR